MDFLFAVDTEPYRVTLHGKDASAVLCKLKKEIDYGRCDASPPRLWFENQSQLSRAVTMLKRLKS